MFRQLEEGMETAARAWAALASDAARASWSSSQLLLLLPPRRKFCPVVSEPASAEPSCGVPEAAARMRNATETRWPPRVLLATLAVFLPPLPWSLAAGSRRPAEPTASRDAGTGIPAMRGGVRFAAL